MTYSIMMDVNVDDDNNMEDWELEDAIKEIQTSKWLESNKEALLAHNLRVEKEGTLLKPDWIPE